MRIICYLTWEEARTVPMVHGPDLLSRDWHELQKIPWTIIVIIVEVRHREHKVVPGPLAAIVETVPHEDASITLGFKLGHSLGGVWLRQEGNQ